MDIASLFFLSLSLCVIIFNVCLLYFSYKDIKRRRQELIEYKWDYIERMDEYYKQKDFLLKSILKPTLIHKQTTYNYYGNKNILYFLFYEMPQGTFHLPIDEQYAKKRQSWA